MELRFGESGEHVPRDLRADSGQLLKNPEPGYSVSRIFRPAKHTQEVFHMCGLEELQTAVFCERNVAPDKFDLERRAVMGGTEQNRLALKVDAGFTMLQDTFDRIQNQRRLIGGLDELRLLAGELRREKAL